MYIKKNNNFIVVDFVQAAGLTVFTKTAAVSHCRVGKRSISNLCKFTLKPQNKCVEIS